VTNLAFAEIDRELSLQIYFEQENINIKAVQDPNSWDRTLHKNLILTKLLKKLSEMSEYRSVLIY
jgi:hypothetical protein